MLNLQNNDHFIELTTKFILHTYKASLTQHIFYPQRMYSPSISQQKQNRKQIFNSQVHSTAYMKQSALMKQSISTRQYTQVKSQQNLHVLKLQSRALQLLRKIQHQKFQILTLTEQTQGLMRLCDQQKSYIKSVNVDMMKQQYQEEVKLLEGERDRLMELIIAMKEEKQLTHIDRQQKIDDARYQNQLLSQKIEQALMQKQQLLKMANENQKNKQQYRQRITEQQEKQDQLRHVERKVVISVKELEQLRAKQFQL